MEAPHPFLEAAVSALKLLMCSSGASGYGMPGAGTEWNLKRAPRANPLIAVPPSQHSFAGRVMTLPSSAMMLAASRRGRTASMVAAAVTGDHDRDLLHRQAPLAGLAAARLRGALRRSRRAPLKAPG